MPHLNLVRAFGSPHGLAKPSCGMPSWPRARAAWPAWIAVVLVGTPMMMAGAGCSRIQVTELGLGGPGGSGAETATAAGGSGSGSGTGGGGSTVGRGGNLTGRGGSPAACDPCSDFPADPIIDSASGTPPPPNAAAILGPPGAPTSSAAPCLVEPEPGSVFPRNWLRPRFRFIPAAGQDLFELRLHVANEVNDLVVHTTATTWTMPKDMWRGLSAHAIDRDITVTVRGVSKATAGAVTPGSGAGIGTSSIIRIAPTAAEGTVVYWTTSGGSALKGFRIGDENVLTVLGPTNTSGQCVGCHSSTPDGAFIGFSASPAAIGDASHIEIRSGQDPTQQPAYLTPSAQTLLARVAQHLPTFSAAHWTTGDRVVVVAQSPLPGVPAQTHLDWIDLEATSTVEGVGWGEIARTGDSSSSPAHPFLSHDGKSLIYASSSAQIRGGFVEHGNLYRVPYGNRMGGTATPIPGASTSQFNEFYPALSNDDTLLAFTRNPDGQSSYDNGQSEIFVIPATGGTATRVTANDPVSCLNRTSPGVTNSWPKWAPTSQGANGKTYYWMIFSSKRMDSNHPQLYLTGVVKDELGGVTTTPALYLWNQPASENNHTPAWDVFQIPVVP